MKSLKDIDLRGNRISKGGFEEVSSLPWSGNFVGRQVNYHGMPHTWDGEKWECLVNGGWYKRDNLLASNGILIKTNIDAIAPKKVYLEIIGEGFHSGNVIHTIAGANYDGDNPVFMALNACNIGTRFSEIKVFSLDKKITFWLPWIANLLHSTIFAKVLIGNANEDTNHIISITPSAIPAEGVDKLATITPKNVALTSEIPAAYKLPTATTSRLGGIKASNTLSVDSGGEAKVVDDAHNHTASTINWGGANYTNNILPVDLAMNETASANKFAFIKPAAITVKYSRDAGATWLDYGATDEDKVRLTTIWNAPNFRIGKVTQNSEASTDCRLRVEIDRVNAGVYLHIRKFMLWVSTDGSTNNYVTISKLTKGNYDAGNTTDEFFEVVVYKQTLYGWSGWNVINTNIVFGPNSDIQARIIRFDFGYDTAPTGSNLGLVIYNIFAYCSESWTNASTLAKFGHLYSFDYLQNAIFPANVTAEKIIKSGGTASQFLKANGDVDGTTYTPQTETGANNLISALPVWTKNPNDNTYIIRQDTGGSNTYGRVKASALWEYIKSKAGILYQPKGNYADGDEQGFLVKKPKISIAGGTTAGNDMFTFDGSDEFHLDLAKVAVSGSYNDLKDKPTIPQPQMVGSGVLTIMQGTVNKGMFSANATAGKTITLDAPETGATINGVQVSFAAQANNIPCYIDYNNVLYHCRISTDGTALQIFRNGVWADLIKSCSCNPKINETIEVDDLEAMKSAINEGYYSIEMTSNLTTEFINGKLQFSLGFAPSRNVTVATKPVSLKGIKVDTIKQQFQEFLNAGGRFFIENDLSAMISSGQTVCLQVTMQREPIPKVVVECYIEY